MCIRDRHISPLKGPCNIPSNIIILILGLQIWNFQNICLPILAKFRAFRTIWRDPVKHTGQNNSEWYRKCPQIRSGGRFLKGPIGKNTIFLFVDVALRAASTLENRVFLEINEFPFC